MMGAWVRGLFPWKPDLDLSARSTKASGETAQTSRNQNALETKGQSELVLGSFILRLTKSILHHSTKIIASTW